MDTWTYKQQLDWLITMSKHPGFKDHAEHMAKLMDVGPSGMFKGIDKDLERSMKNWNDEQKKAGG